MQYPTEKYNADLEFLCPDGRVTAFREVILSYTVISYTLKMNNVFARLRPFFWTYHCKKASASNETEALFLCVYIANTVIVCYQSLSSSTYSVCSRKNFFSSGLRSRPIVPPGFIR